MSVHLEIEKRYQIETGSLPPLLQQFQYVDEKRVIDEYFDTPDGIWYQKGIFIRIRNNLSLDIKFNPNHLGKTDVSDHVSCHEYSFREPFHKDEEENLKILQRLIGLETSGVNSFHSLLKQNQLKTLLLIDKTRKTYQKERFTLVIDNIKDSGSFLEIEYSGPEGVLLEEVVAEVDALMKGVPAKPLTSGSFEIMLRQSNFELYRKGKYLLEEDLRRSAA